MDLDPVPAFSYGLNIGLTYKNFDLTMFWQGVADVDVYNNQKFQTDFWSITDAGSNKGSRLLGAWTTDNTGSTIPALTTNNTADEDVCHHTSLRMALISNSVHYSWVTTFRLHC